MESSNGANKRRKLGFKKYANSKVISDITVRYGKSGELPFEAHKVLLSAKSGWFAAAFTGGFTKSFTREIILKEDDPDALKTMLDFAYTEEIGPPEDTSLQAHGAASNIHYLLKLYRTGYKYDFPEFQDRVVMCFQSSMCAWFNRSSTPLANDAVAQEEFCGLIKDVYNLVGSEHQPSHPLINILLDLVDNAGPGSILHNTGGNQSLIVTAPQEITEFGRDIFLDLMSKTRSSETDKQSKVITTKLCIGAKVECQTCANIWWRVIQDGEYKRTSVFCVKCGRRHA